MHPSQARQAQSWDAVSPRPHGTDLLQGLASLAHSGGSHGWLCGGLAGTPAGFQPLSRGWGLGRWLSSWWGSPLRGARGSECGDLNGRNKGMVLMTVVSSLFPPSVDPDPAPRIHGLTGLEVGDTPVGTPHAPGRVDPSHHILVHVAPGTTIEPLEKAVFPLSACQPQPRSPHSEAPRPRPLGQDAVPQCHPVPHLPASRVCDAAAGRRAPWGGVAFDTGTPCQREAP